MNKMNGKNEKNQKSSKDLLKTGFIFLAIVVVFASVLAVINPEKTGKALHYSLILFIKLIPLIAVIITLTALINFIIKPGKLSKILGHESGLKGWIIAIAAGIITHGPIYVWFMMLRDMREQGMRDGLIAVFLYNRAIKIPFIPVMIYYFGALYTVTLTLIMVISSPFLGLLVELFSGYRKPRRQEQKT